MASPDEDHARRGRGLEPAGGVHHVPGDHALADGANGDGRLAGEDAGAGLDGRPQPPDGGEELQGGPDRSLGVVLVARRRAPDGHDRVPDELLDRAAVALDDPAGQLEVPRQEIPHLLGVAVLGERREAHEVCEERPRRAGARRPGRRRHGRPRSRRSSRLGCRARSRAGRRTRRRTWRPEGSPRRRRRTPRPAARRSPGRTCAPGRSAPHNVHRSRGSSTAIPATLVHPASGGHPPGAARGSATIRPGAVVVRWRPPSSKRVRLRVRGRVGSTPMRSRQRPRDELMAACPRLWRRGPPLASDQGQWSTMSATPMLRGPQIRSKIATSRSTSFPVLSCGP